MKNKVSFIHFGDAHLGFSGNASKHNEFSSLRIDKEIDGVNIRTLDVNNAFKQVIDFALEKNVDFVVDAGDLFDSWGYKENATYNFAQTQILRLLDKDIQYVGIIGNHDLPKIKNKGTYLQLLSAFPHVHVAYTGFYEKIIFENKNIAFHGIPSSFQQSIMDESLAAVEKEDDLINVGIFHGGVTTIKHYAESAINSLVVDLDRLINLEMDYFALADYHKATDFGYNIHFSGSLLPLSFSELGNVPRVNHVEINIETKEVIVTPLYLNVREMVEIPTFDAKGLEIDDVNAQIEKILSEFDMKDKIVRFTVKNLSKSLKRLINDHLISELTEEALYFKIQFKDMVDKVSEASTGGDTILGVIEGWSEFVKSVENDGTYDTEELFQLGYSYLSEVLD